MLRPFGGGTKATVPTEPPRHPVTGGGLSYCPPDAPSAGVQEGGSGVVPPLSASPCPRGGPARPPRCTHGTRLEELLSVANERWGIN